MKKILILAMVLVSATAFAKPPKWTQKVHWEDGQYDYFVGTSSKSSGEDVGRREAYDNAMAEAVQALFGFSGKMDLASYANLQKIQISQDVFISTGEVQLKAVPVDVYIEKVKEQGVTLYNVWRSIKVDKKAAKEELARLKKLAEQKKTVEAKVIAPEPGLVAVAVEGNSVIMRDDEPSAKAAAIQHAIKRSCEKLLGEWFYSDTLTDNYPKLNSLVYSRCSSFAKNYEVREGGAEDNVYKANLTVYLKEGDIKRRLMEAGLYRQKFPMQTNVSPPAPAQVPDSDATEGPESE